MEFEIAYEIFPLPKPLWIPRSLMLPVHFLSLAFQNLEFFEYKLIIILWPGVWLVGEGLSEWSWKYTTRFAALSLTACRWYVVFSRLCTRLRPNLYKTTPEKGEKESSVSSLTVLCLDILFPDHIATCSASWVKRLSILFQEGMYVSSVYPWPVLMYTKLMPSRQTITTRDVCLILEFLHPQVLSSLSDIIILTAPGSFSF
jgi:hypothetical protein